MVREICRSLRPVLVLTALAVSLSACSGGDDAAATPADFTVHERPEFSFSTPPEWEVRLDEPEDIEVVGVEVVDDAVEAVRAKVGNYEGTDVRLAGQAALDVFRVGGAEDHEITDEREVEVAGADEAVLFDATYVGESTDERIRQWDVFASADGSTRVVYLTLKAPTSVFDSDEMTAILDSLEVTL